MDKATLLQGVRIGLYETPETAWCSPNQGDWNGNGSTERPVWGPGIGELCNTWLQMLQYVLKANGFLHRKGLEIVWYLKT